MTVSKRQQDAILTNVKKNNLTTRSHHDSDHSKFSNNFNIISIENFQLNASRIHDLFSNSNEILLMYI